MSARIHLNLATRPFERTRRFWVLATVSAGVLVLGTFVLAGIFINNYRNEQTHSHQMNSLRQEIARLDAEQKALEEALRRPEAVDVLDRSEFLNSLIRQKAVSWTLLFMDLEKLLPERVQILTLRPVVREAKDAKEELAPGSPLQMDLNLDAASDNIAGLLEMSHRMEKSDRFGLQSYRVESPPVGTDNMFKLTLSVVYAQK